MFFFREHYLFHFQHPLIKTNEDTQTMGTSKQRMPFLQELKQTLIDRNEKTPSVKTHESLALTSEVIGLNGLFVTLVLFQPQTLIKSPASQRPDCSQDAIGTALPSSAGKGGAGLLYMEELRERISQRYTSSADTSNSSL